MTTISIDVSDDLIKAYGLKAIQERMEHFIQMEKLSVLAREIQDAVEEAGLNHDELWEEARRQAWEEFKDQDSRIRNIIK